MKFFYASNLQLMNISYISNTASPTTQTPGTNTKKNCYLLAAMIRKAC